MCVCVCVTRWLHFVSCGFYFLTLHNELILDPIRFWFVRGVARLFFFNWIVVPNMFTWSMKSRWLHEALRRNFNFAATTNREGKFPLVCKSVFASFAIRDLKKNNRKRNKQINMRISHIHTQTKNASNFRVTKYFVFCMLLFLLLTARVRLNYCNHRSISIWMRRKSLSCHLQ